MELSTIKDATTICSDSKEMNFSFETKSGGIQYLPAVRNLIIGSTNSSSQNI